LPLNKSLRKSQMPYPDAVVVGPFGMKARSLGLSSVLNTYYEHTNHLIFSASYCMLLIMNKILNSASLEKALTLLGIVLSNAAAKPISLVVCGGSALIATGLVSRTTKDVDIVALLGPGNSLIDAEPLPSGLLESAKLVAEELQLQSDWLNNGPRSLFNIHLPNNGFPEGLVERAHIRNFSDSLQIVIISRFDQIHFKLYAAADRGGPSYHLDDLIQLNPTDHELLLAARWAMLQDPTTEFASIVRKMLTVLGFGHVAAGI
jgi:hypothetical protein